EQGLLDGLAPTLAGLAEGPGGGSRRLRSWLETASAHIAKAVASFHPGVPIEAGRHVLEGAEALRLALAGLDDEDLGASARAAIRRALVAKLQDFDDVAARCLGLRVEASVSPARV